MLAVAVAVNTPVAVKAETKNKISEHVISENEVEVISDNSVEVVEVIEEDEDVESVLLDFGEFSIPEAVISDEELLVGVDEYDEIDEDLEELLPEDEEEVVVVEELEEEATVVSGFTLPDIPIYMEDDVELLAKLIWHESEGEPREGKIAVGEVVVNRINSPFYPDTVHDVIYQAGQFSYVQYVKYEHPDAETRLIAEDVLNHDLKVLNNEDVLYFRNPTITSGISASEERNWGRHKYYTYYAHHAFYLHSPFRSTDTVFKRRKFYNILDENACAELRKQDKEKKIEVAEVTDNKIEVIGESVSENGVDVISNEEITSVSDNNLVEEIPENDEISSENEPIFVVDEFGNVQEIF